MAGPKRYSRNHRDAIEERLVALATRLGCAWHEDGPLDGWALHRGVWVPVEVKDPERKGRADEFEPAQIAFMRWCDARRGPYRVWRTESDVMRHVGALQTA